MKTPHALLLGLALVALAIIIVGRADRADAETHLVGTYAFASGESGLVIGSTATGEAWRCGPVDFTCKRLGLAQ